MKVAGHQTQLSSGFLCELSRHSRHLGPGNATSRTGERYVALVPLTFWDMGLYTRAESWRRLRALRAAPPTPTDARRRLFGASLEQAEQQLLAAASVGVQSRPLNLFYGLSQAGRALAASMAPIGDSAQLVGHGIRCPGLAQSGQNPISHFPDLQIRGDGGPATSFRRLSTLLHSAPLDDAVGLGDLWAMLVEPILHEPLDQRERSVHIVSATRHNHDMLRVTVAGLPPGFAPEDFNALLRDFPSLVGMEFTRVSGESVNARGDVTASVELLQRSTNDPSAVGIDYRGTRVILPSLARGMSTMHPLMVWWAVLYALSMLARYQPESWTALTNVDNSPFAVPIGYLLDVAQDAVPDLLWRTLTSA